MVQIFCSSKMYFDYSSLSNEYEKIYIFANKQYEYEKKNHSQLPQIWEGVSFTAGAPDII